MRSVALNHRKVGKDSRCPLLLSLPDALLQSIVKHLSSHKRNTGVSLSCKALLNVYCESMSTICIDLSGSTSRKLRETILHRRQKFSSARNIVLFDLNQSVENPENVRHLLTFNPKAILNEDVEKTETGSAKFSLKVALSSLSGLTSLNGTRAMVLQYCLTLAIPGLSISTSELESYLGGTQGSGTIEQLHILHGNVALTGQLLSCLFSVSTDDMQIDSISKNLAQNALVYSKLENIIVQLSRPATAIKMIRLLSSPAFPRLKRLSLYFKPQIRLDIDDQKTLELLEAPLLEELYLKNAPLATNGFEALTQLKQLRKLHITYESDYYDNDDDEDVRPSLNSDASLGALARLPHLHSLCIHSLADDVGLNLLAAQLTELEISPEEDSTLTEFHELPNLRRLIVDLGIDSDGMDMVAPYGNLHLPDINMLSNLETLEVKSLLWQGGQQEPAAEWDYMQVVGSDDDDDDDDESVAMDGVEFVNENEDVEDSSDEESELAEEDEEDGDDGSDVDFENEEEESSEDESEEEDSEDEEEEKDDTIMEVEVVAGGANKKAGKAVDGWRPAFEELERQYIAKLLVKLPSVNEVKLSDFCSNFVGDMLVSVGNGVLCKSNVLVGWEFKLSELNIVEGDVSEYEIVWRRH